MTGLLVGDIGGTHARFAIADLATDRVRLRALRTSPVAAHDGLAGALHAYLANCANERPRQACLAVAGPVRSGPFTLTNSGWTIDRADLAVQCDLQDVRLINDFEAIAYNLMDPTEAHLVDLAGAPGPLPDAPVTVMGPGTGLGVAIVLPGGQVVPTEGGHVGFAPSDAADIALLKWLQGRHGRVSAERLASGPGLAAIAGAMGQGEGVLDPDLWAAALAGEAALVPVLSRWLSILGRLAGDLVLAHGSGALVLAGSLVERLGPRLAADPFLAGFRDKGRFADMMAACPIRRLAQPEPGLTGAALAWLARRRPADRDGPAHGP